MYVNKQVISGLYAQLDSFFTIYFWTTKMYEIQHTIWAVAEVGG